MDETFFNSINLPNIPPHVLQLKVAMECYITRNLSPKDNLLNNTPVKIKAMSRKLVTVELMETKEIFFIPRITFNLQLGQIRGIRKQFPLRPAYVKTFNRSQGTTMDKCAVDLREQPFSHGQLYVALSRVRSNKDILLLIKESKTGVAKTTNIVYEELLDKTDIQEAEKQFQKSYNIGQQLLQNDKKILRAGDTTSSTYNKSSSTTTLVVQQSSSTPNLTFNNQDIPGVIFQSTIELLGPKWRSNSCAFDTAFMCFMHMYKNGSTAWQTLFDSSQDQTSPIIHDLLKIGLTVGTTKQMNRLRNQFRARLEIIDPQSFAQTGPSTSMSAITEQIYNINRATGRIIVPCIRCNTCKHVEEVQNICNKVIPIVWLQSVWDHNSKRLNLQTTTSTPFSNWLRLLMVPNEDIILLDSYSKQCTQKDCYGIMHIIDGRITNPLPFLFFEIGAELKPIPIPTRILSIEGITGQNYKYVLSAIGYYDTIHFVSKLFTKNDSFYYDGMTNNGIARKIQAESINDATSLDLEKLITFNQFKQHIYFYQLSDPI